MAKKKSRIRKDTKKLGKSFNKSVGVIKKDIKWVGKKLKKKKK